MFGKFQKILVEFQTSPKFLINSFQNNSFLPNASFCLNPMLSITPYILRVLKIVQI